MAALQRTATMATRALNHSAIAHYRQSLASTARIEKMWQQIELLRVENSREASLAAQTTHRSAVSNVQENMYDHMDTTPGYSSLRVVNWCGCLASLRVKRSFGYQFSSQVPSGKLGPHRWIPTRVCLWSVVAVSQAALSGKVNF